MAGPENGDKVINSSNEYPPFSPRKRRLFARGLQPVRFPLGNPKRGSRPGTTQTMTRSQGIDGHPRFLERMKTTKDYGFQEFTGVKITKIKEVS